MAMRRVAVVQARTGSTRLPGKVLRDLAGRPLLAQMLRRLEVCSNLDALVVATSTDRRDDAVAELAATLGVRVYRGPLDDVLARFVGAARAACADVVVRLTADCPLIDPATTDRVVGELVEHAGSCDYASNVLVRTYPRGLETEAFFLDTLLRVDRLAASAGEREHVTTAIYSVRPELFLRRSVEDAEDNSDLRWTVDEEVDLEVVRTIYDALDLGRVVAPYRDVLAWARAHPEVSGRNAAVTTWTPAPDPP